MKKNLQLTEDMLYWFKQKTEDFVNITRLSGLKIKSSTKQLNNSSFSFSKGPLKSIDYAAANSLDHLEKTRLKV